MSFSKGIISLLVNDCMDCTRGNADKENPLIWVNINTKDGSITSAKDEKYFSSNHLKAKYFSFVPGNPSLCVVMLRNQNIEKNPGKSTTFQLLQMKDAKITMLDEWVMDAQTQNTAAGNTLCYDDSFGHGITKISAMPDGKGFYLITIRDHRYSSCDTKGQKNWQYFFVMTMDANGKFIKNKFFPIFNPEKVMDAGDADISYKLSGNKLLVKSNFSKDYYINNKPDTDITTDRVPAVLTISPDLSTEFNEIK